ncbi:MAG: TRAP transporter substrate-binding protein DctP [Deltaproteobacteria bacterium]|nr:TRAP transporter substrate-binding protein DctP [Deltaproteobacteria bacterium]
MKRLIIMIALFLVASTSHAAQEIKFALLAPEGSTWAKIIHEWDEELRAKTANRLALKIYAGGVLGDESDVIRKMRIGQVHAGAFTSMGLGFINPASRLFDLPFMFQTYAEVDAVATKLQPKLEPGFLPKGFVLLGWTETGFVNIFSNKPAASRKDLKGMRMWAWEGDPLVEALYRQFSIVPIPLALPDVYTSLQTNLIDAVYAPPLGAIAMQWFSRTKYITDLKLANSVGGILITQKAYMSIPEPDRKILMETARTYARKVIERTRVENEQSYAALTKAGLTMVNVPAEEAVAIRETSVKVWDGLVGKLYSTEQLNEAKAALDAFRAVKK